MKQLYKVKNMNDAFYTIVKRGLVNISGEDRKTFLQNIITNDVNKLDQVHCLYACLLTPQGKFLHDFFITEKNQTLILECEPDDRCEDLAKRLKLYALRANINISTIPDQDVYLTIGQNHGYKDPRSDHIGYRAFNAPKSLEHYDFNRWDTIRIKHNIPDGSRDMIPEKSTLLESRIDKLSGISFDKGCYIGQELTARMHYRGLAKKHFHTLSAETLKLEKLPDYNEDIIINDKKAGSMRSSNKERNYGIALLKNEFISTIIGQK